MPLFFIFVIESAWKKEPGHSKQCQSRGTPSYLTRYFHRNLVHLHGRRPRKRVCIGKSGPMLLTRSVLYTAITRAKSLLIIVGDESAAYHMIDNQTQTRRYSGLRARLCGECGAV